MICSLSSFPTLTTLAVPETNPTDNKWTFTKQNKTDGLAKQQQKILDRYFNGILDGKEIICYVLPSANQYT